MGDKTKKEINVFEENYGLVKISQRGTLWFKFIGISDDDFDNMIDIITSSENDRVKSHFLYILPYDINFNTVDLICNFISYLNHIRNNSIKIVFVTLGDKYTEAFANLILAKINSNSIEISTRAELTVGFKTKKGSPIKYTSICNVTQDYNIIRIFKKCTYDDKILHKVYKFNNDDIVAIDITDILSCDKNCIASTPKMVQQVRKNHWAEIKRASYHKMI